jgi:hypothetical protein
MGPEPGIRTMIDDPGTVTSGFSVRGMVTKDRMPMTVRKIKTIQVKERLSMASWGSLIVLKFDPDSPLSHGNLSRYTWPPP